ncbi:MAG: hypothetical protein WC223_03350 [Bacteroidales bacterium]|jgi:hypothetical protein
MKRKIFLLSILAIALVSCKKVAGPEGPAGKDGTNGLDANATCKQCHNATVVDEKSTEFKLSKHSYGTAAFEEAGSTGCAPCHESEGFKYVCKNNIPATFTLSGSSYVNNYAATSSTSYGEIGCFTCHSSLHTTYGYSDISPLTTTAAVPMTMWGGTKTINITQSGGKSNLCIKCHQPRPVTKSTDKNVIDYAALSSNPTAVLYDTTTGATNVLKPSYRTGIHYGSVGAIYAGIGGIEFSGSLSYSNSTHTTVASCQDCHTAAMTGKAGGHTFVAKGNFNGCNVSGCHSASPITATSTKFTTPRTNHKTLLNQLAAKLKQDGIEILNRNPDTETNLWAGLTTNNYDGYLNIYDPASNPDGETNNAGQFRNPSPGSSWTSAQTAYNLTLPKLKLTNAQMGAIINFQLCLREYSLGIHNTSYSEALLTNSIAVLP